TWCVSWPTGNSTKSGERYRKIGWTPGPVSRENAQMRKRRLGPWLALALCVHRGRGATLLLLGTLGCRATGSPMLAPVADTAGYVGSEIAVMLRADMPDQDELVFAYAAPDI